MLSLLACAFALLADTSVTGTLCSGAKASVQLNRFSAVNVLLSTQTQSYTAGVFFATLVPGSDGSYYRATITCPSSSTVQKWLIPDVASATTAQISVAESVAVDAGWYWDTATTSWKHVSAGVAGSGGGGSGDVVGPASSVNNQAVKFNGTSGKAVTAETGSGYAKYTTGVPAFSATIPQADVVSLTTDLAAKAAKITGATGVLKTDTSGVLAVVSGTGTDCVKVDGTSGACGTGGGGTSAADGVTLIDTGSTLGVNTAVIQAVNTVSISSASGTTFVATLTPPITAYANKQIIQFTPNQTCTGSPTLNLHTIGAKNMYNQDGTTAIACTNAYPLQLIYDTALAAGAGGWRKLTPEPAASAERLVLLLGNFTSNATIATGAASVMPISGGLSFGSNFRFTRIPVAGTLRKMGMVTTSTGPIDSTSTCTLQGSADNVTYAAIGAPSSISFTIPTTGAAGVYQDTTNTATIAAGTYVRWSCAQTGPSISGFIHTAFGELVLP